MMASTIAVAVASAHAREQGMTGKNPTLAELGLGSAAHRKFEIESCPDTVNTDGTKAAHDAAMEGIGRVGTIPGSWPSKPDDPLAANLARMCAATDVDESAAAGPAFCARHVAEPCLSRRVVARGALAAEQAAHRLRNGMPPRHAPGAAQVLAIHLGYVRQLLNLKEVVAGLVWPVDLAGLKLSSQSS